MKTGIKKAEDFDLFELTDEEKREKSIAKGRDIMQRLEGDEWLEKATKLPSIVLDANRVFYKASACQECLKPTRGGHVVKVRHENGLAVGRLIENGWTTTIQNVRGAGPLPEALHVPFVL